MDGLIAYALMGTGMVILSLLSPFTGFLAYMAILYLRPQELIPELADMNPTRTAAIILLAAVGLRISSGEIRLAFPKEIRPLLAFLGVILASFVAGYWGYAMHIFEGMVKNAIAFWLIVTLVNTEGRLRAFLWTLLAFQGFMAADTLRDYLTFQEAGLDEVRLGAFARGYFGGAGDFAAMTNILVPFALFLALGERGLVRRVAALGVLAVLVGGVVATLARGAGVVALGVALGTSALLASVRDRGFKRLASLAISAALTGVLVVAAPSKFVERTTSILSYRQEETADSRIYFWKVGLRMFAANPILGVGAGQYSANFWAYGGPRWMGWRASHNTFIDLVSQLGLAGIVAFGWLVVVVGRGLWHARSRLDPRKPSDRFLFAVSSATLVSLVTYFAAGMFQSILYYPQLYIHMAVAVKTREMIERQKEVARSARPVAGRGVLGVGQP